MYSIIQSVMNKIPELQCIIDIHQSLFVSLVETWLTNTFPPSKVLKIHDDEQEKGKNQDCSGLKADVSSIELE